MFSRVRQLLEVATAPLRAIASPRDGERITPSDAQRSAAGRLLQHTLAIAYRPSVPNTQFWGTDGLPRLAILNDIEFMLQHPVVSLYFGYYCAGTAPAQFAIKRASSKQVAEFALAEIKRFWAQGLPHLHPNMAFGWGGHEVLYTRSPDGLLIFEDLYSFSPRDAVPLTRRHELVGIRVRRATDEGMQGTLDLWGPGLYPSKCFWYAHRPRYQSWYGLSQLFGAWRPWRRLAGRDGGEEIVDGAYYRFGFQGPTVWYPNETTTASKQPRWAGDTPMSNRDFARQMAESLKAGASLAMANDRDQHGNRRWEIEWPTGSFQGDSLLNYAQSLEKLIALGIGVPPEIMQASDTGSGYSGREIPKEAFFLGQQTVAESIKACWERYIGRPLVKWNFGPDAWFEMEVLPLLGSHNAAANGKSEGKDQSQAKDAPPGGGDDPPPEDGDGPPQPKEPDNPLADLLGTRAPVGGIEIAGKHYPGGQFIPNKELAKASFDQLQTLREKGKLKEEHHEKIVRYQVARRQHRKNFRERSQLLKHRTREYHEHLADQPAAQALFAPLRQLAPKLAAARSIPEVKRILKQEWPPLVQRATAKAKQVVRQQVDEATAELAEKYGKPAAKILRRGLAGMAEDYLEELISSIGLSKEPDSLWEIARSEKDGSNRAAELADLLNEKIDAFVELDVGSHLDVVHQTLDPQRSWDPLGESMFDFVNQLQRTARVKTGEQSRKFYRDRFGLELPEARPGEDAEDYQDRVSDAISPLHDRLKHEIAPVLLRRLMADYDDPGRVETLKANREKLESLIFGKRPTTTPHTLGTRAPVGGIDIDGTHYQGGMFIPNRVLKQMSPKERKQLRSKINRQNSAAATGGAAAPGQPPAPAHAAVPPSSPASRKMAKRLKAAGKLAWHWYNVTYHAGGDAVKEVAAARGLDEARTKRVAKFAFLADLAHGVVASIPFAAEMAGKIPGLGIPEGLGHAISDAIGISHDAATAAAMLPAASIAYVAYSGVKQPIKTMKAAWAAIKHTWSHSKELTKEHARDLLATPNPQTPEQKRAQADLLAEVFAAVPEAQQEWFEALLSAALDHTRNLAEAIHLAQRTLLEQQAKSGGGDWGQLDLLGFTGEITDKLGRKRYYLDGKPVAREKYQQAGGTQGAKPEDASAGNPATPPGEHATVDYRHKDPTHPVARAIAAHATGRALAARAKEVVARIEHLTALRKAEVQAYNRVADMKRDDPGYAQAVEAWRQADQQAQGQYAERQKLVEQFRAEVFDRLKVDNGVQLDSQPAPDSEVWKHSTKAERKQLARSSHATGLVLTLSDAQAMELEAADPRRKGKTQAAVEAAAQAREILGSICESRGKPLSVAVGHSSTGRAFADIAADNTKRTSNAIAMDHLTPNEDMVHIAIHEYAHIIERAYPDIHRRVIEFWEYRLGDEEPTDIGDLPGGQDMAGEYGRKDQFDRAFDLVSAYYVGKFYSTGSTEILSMGMEKLSRDPLEFFAKDPEYAAFIVSVLRPPASGE